MNTLTLELYGAPNCPYCALLKPKLLAYCNEQNIRIDNIDTNTDEGGIVAEQKKIISIPTVIFYVNGVEVNRMVGQLFPAVKENIVYAMKKLSGGVEID